MPSHRIISAILELTGDATCVKIDPSVDINDQLQSVLRNTGMQVTEEDFNNAVVTILVAAATAAGVIIAILVPEPASTAAGATKAAKFIIGSIANVCTYWGAPSAFTKLNAYLLKCGFERAFTEGNANVAMSKYVGIGLGNIWDDRESAPYIYKFSVMHDRETVNTSISKNQIIDRCNWHLED